MSKEREEKVMACANEIADQFTEGFCNDRMVENFATVIRGYLMMAAHEASIEAVTEHNKKSLEIMEEQTDLHKLEMEKGQEKLRDHFAGLAMQGLLANSNMGDAALHDSSEEWLKDIAESSYTFADAMLEVKGEIND